VGLASGLPFPRFLALEGGDWRGSREDIVRRVKGELGFPCVVKPNALGSSIGVSIVRVEDDLSDAVELALRHGEIVLAEEYLRGTELTCAILEDPETGIPTPLPLIEIVPKGEFFDYEAKYAEGASEEIVPARVGADLTHEAQTLALRAHRALGCEGMSRVDMFARDGSVVLLEVNTIPGLTAGSLLPKAAAAAGIGFPELVHRIIGNTLRRERIRRRGRPRE
jgi:D-alanine-D-alanine ligase